MKLKIIIFSLLLCGLYSCQQVACGLSDYELQGNVKEVKSYVYSAVEKFGKISKGKKISRTKSSIFGSDFENTVIKFDEYGSMLCHSDYSKHNRLESKMFIKGNVLNLYRGNGDLSMRCIGNDSIRPTKTSLYSSNGDLLGKIISKYNKLDELILTKFYNASGDEMTSIMFRYNKYSQLVKEKEEGITKSNHSWRKDVHSSIYKEYTYNDEGYVASIKKIVNNKCSIINYKYEYDREYNWTKRIEFSKIRAEKIIEREISYY